MLDIVKSDTVFGYEIYYVCLDSLGTIIDGSNGDVAVDQYHRYKVSNNNFSHGQIIFFFFGLFAPDQCYLPKTVSICTVFNAFSPYLC